jgi:hypothetical protein
MTRRWPATPGPLRAREHITCTELLDSIVTALQRLGKSPLL